jgi:hypothetical protein
MTSCRVCMVGDRAKPKNPLPSDAISVGMAALLEARSNADKAARSASPALTTGGYTPDGREARWVGHYRCPLAKCNSGSVAWRTNLCAEF